MATEETENKEKPKTMEDYFSEIIKNPIGTFSGGAIAGLLIGIYRGDKKIEKLEEDYAQQAKKRDEQFDMFVKQMALSNARQEKLMKAFALHSGQDIPSLEEGNKE